MSFGVVMLVHTALDRAEQVARHWAQAGCPVVIHVDRNVSRAAYRGFAEGLSDLENVLFSKRHRCEWGGWGLVAATQDAAAHLLRHFPEVGHVYLTSGACLPLRPIAELTDYLRARPDTDFIESATTTDVPWTVGGLEEERFTLFFPFSWRRQRALFDGFVELQRRLRVRRRIPSGLVPHMGSQWWCLSRRTLDAILQDPDRPTYDRYFSRVWIPDEAYFQTLSRLHSDRIESRSLTLSKFDFQGKPHTFYDDHLQLLRRSDCFVARKIWPRAQRLYATFLNEPNQIGDRSEPNPGKIDRVFSLAVQRRTQGRPGLYMQSRFPNDGWERNLSAARYSVFQGFDDLFEDFGEWLSDKTEAQVHGHLFAPERAEFAGGETILNGAQPDTATLRDYNPRAFLTNFIWNTRGARQAFMYGPNDTFDTVYDLARDGNAQVSVISGAWAIPLHRSGASFAQIRETAARLQKTEARQIEILRAQWTRARVRIWTLADFVDAPMDALKPIVEEIGLEGQTRLLDTPRMNDLSELGDFLQRLRNAGMHPHLMGDFSVNRLPRSASAAPRKQYLVN